MDVVCFDGSLDDDAAAADDNKVLLHLDDRHDVFALIEILVDGGLNALV